MGRHLVATAIQAGSATKATEAGATARWSRGRQAKDVLGLISFLAFVLIPHIADAQDISVNFGDNTSLTQRAVQLIGLITLLSLAPSILVMVTSFTRIMPGEASAFAAYIELLTTGETRQLEVCEPPAPGTRGAAAGKKLP